MRKPDILSLIRNAVLYGGMAAAAAAQAQPVITGITPDGSVLFQPSNTLSFVATAPAGISNITVQLNGAKLSGATFLKIYSSNSGLTIANAPTGGGQNVSAPLTADTIYNVTITAVDNTGASTTSTVAFDTITPAYTFEAEDYDFDGGQFIDNPQTNAYSGKTAMGGVDASNANGSNAYRPCGTADAPGGLATEGCGDKTRVAYVGTGMTDYDICYTDGGDWANYTRYFPQGSFNIFMRGANPNGAGTQNATITAPITGRFPVPNTGGWQNYTWVPLVDDAGERVVFDSDGSAQTMRIDVVGGSFNANFYMLVPAIPNTTPVSDATVIDAYPDGANQFQATNSFQFTISSTLGVNKADVAVQLTATTLALKSTSTLLLPGDGLTISGDSKNLLASIPLSSNMVYSALISASDANGVPMTKTIKFDTITPAYTWEAEDWDYGAGQFIDDPAQVNGYAGLDGVENIDFARPSTGGGSAYGRAGLASENAGDIPRLSRDPSLQDYDIGNNGTGNWVNYTRNWPDGIYNIFIRVANANSGTTADSGALSLVKSGVGTENQVTSQLGSYSSPGTGGWQTYGWQPILDSGGNLARFVGGAQKTLRHTVNGGNANQGFYMLIPADNSVHTLPFVSDFKPDGSAMFQPTNLMTFTANSAAGLATTGVVVTVDGVKLASLTLKGSANEWQVSAPISINSYHTVVVALTDNYGSTTNTYRVATFEQAKTYIFEAEDYDYSGGQFFDNPQVNSYAGLDAIAEVDTHVVSGFDGTHVPYRPSGLNQENASDVFVSPEHVGIQNYDLGNTVAGNWGNYTRTYPAGKFNIYMRAANGNSTPSAGGSMQQVTAGLGTTSQTTVDLGTFDPVPTGGWQVYYWVPLRDANGNLAVFTGGGVKTLRAICGGGQNNDYYALVPADESQPVIGELYPNGSSLFQKSDTLKFVAVSSAGIDTNTIVVTLNGAPVTGLVITGSSTSWNVSYPNLLPNTTYTASISFASMNGGVVGKTFGFDTFAPSNYTWEAEDFNYDNGKYFDNPQTNAYSGLIAVDMVDAHNTDGGAGYRPVGTADAPGGLSTEGCGDLARAPYIGTGITDYDVGYTSAGDWANYTRHFPKGNYNIYMRAANPNAAGTDTVEISGPVAGRFNVPNTGNWQVYTWVPMVDASGKLVQYVSDGSEQTMKISTIAGIYNANFYMLVPVESANIASPTLTVTHNVAKISIAFATEVGVTYQVQYKSSLSDTTWTSLGGPVSGNGSAQTVADTATEATRFYRVSAVK